MGGGREVEGAKEGAAGRGPASPPERHERRLPSGVCGILGGSGTEGGGRRSVNLKISWTIGHREDRRQGPDNPNGESAPSDPSGGWSRIRIKPPPKK